MLTRAQLDTILLDPDVGTALQKLVDAGILSQLFPEVQIIVGFGGLSKGHKDLWGHTKKVVSQCPFSVVIRWAALFHDVGKVPSIKYNLKGEVTFHNHEILSATLFRKAAKRTHFFTSEEVERIGFIVEKLGYLEGFDKDWSDSAIRRLYKALGPHYEDIISLSKADLTTANMAKKEKVLASIQKLQARVIEVSSKDSLKPMLPKGLGEVVASTFGLKLKQIGDVMTVLKEAVANGNIPWPPTFEEAIEYAREAIINHHHPKE